MAPSTEFSFAEIEQTIDLNCKAPAVLINFCAPFMGAGSKILNVSSASSFQPVPHKFIRRVESLRAQLFARTECRVETS